MAIVIPEMGFEDVPISPVIRDDTVTKKKPKTTISRAAMKLPRVGIWGATASAPASRSEPTSTTLSGMSRSVRILAAIDEPKPKSLTLSRKLLALAYWPFFMVS